MKRFLLVLLLAAFALMPAQKADAQFAVVDAAVAALLEVSFVEQAIHYAQVGMDTYESIMQFIQMCKYLGEQVKLTYQHLKTITDVRSFSDFMHFYNKGLAMEKAVMDTAKNMTITIGKDTHSIWDYQDIFEGAHDTFSLKKNYGKNFTEEQRREMWLGLGLTPANYAYRTGLEAKRKDLHLEALTLAQIVDKDNARKTQRFHEIHDMISQDHILDFDAQLSPKQLAQLQVEVGLETAMSINDLIYYTAKMYEKQVVDEWLRETPYDAPVISSFPANGFRPLKDPPAKK